MEKCEDTSVIMYLQHLFVARSGELKYLFPPSQMCPEHVPLYLGPNQSQYTSVTSNLFNVCSVNNSERKGKFRDNL